MNHWNHFVYRLWSPIYDALLDRFFAPGRRRAMQVLDLRPGERVLLVGVGTGADLPLLPAGICGAGLDLSPDMLARAQAKLPLPERDVTLILGDALTLSLLGVGQFDAVVLHLVLSVVPDGAACLREALRTLRPNGRAVIFDKFAPDDGRLTLGRRLVNLVTTLTGTDVTQRFGDMAAGSRSAKVHDEPCLLRGAYRVILLRKQAPPPVRADHTIYTCANALSADHERVLSMGASP